MSVSLITYCVILVITYNCEHIFLLYLLSYYSKNFVIVFEYFFNHINF